MADYRFPGFTFDTDSLELKGESGPVPLEPQVFQLLQFLIENRERVVSKDEIIDVVWDGRIVSDTALNTRIAAIRRAVGDDGKTQAVIRTFPRRGFRFVAPLSEGGNLVESEQPLPLPDRPSIAVLPFTNMSGDPEQEYFADGITEDIITALSRIRQLFVISRMTTFTYKGQTVDIKTVTKDLGVRYVLEGSVRRAGNRVRISSQLIDGLTGSHLWAEQFDRDLEGIFVLQDEITQIVASAIEPEITKAEFARVHHAPLEDLDIWSTYQRGMYHFHRRTPEDEELAKDLFGVVIDRAPDFSAAHASLARVYSRGADQRVDENFQDHKSMAIHEARTAISLDPEDAYAYVALGYALQHANLDEATGAFEHALSLNPNSAFAREGLGKTLVLSGRAAEGKQYLEEAVRLSPRGPLVGLWYWCLGTANFATGDYVSTLACSDMGKRMNQTPQALDAAARLAALAFLGREAEIPGEREDMLRQLPGFSISRIRAAYPDFDGSLTEGLRKAGLPEPKE